MGMRVGKAVGECVAHSCWICDSCTPTIDYPDGDLYELSADYSPPTPLAPPQPPAPAFYEVKADNSRCMSAVGDAITIVAGDAGSGDFGSGGAVAGRPLPRQEE